MITFDGSNFDEIQEFVGDKVHLVYNAFDELRLIDRLGNELGPMLKVGDTLDRQDGQLVKIEK